MVTYNRADLLGRMLDGLAAQTHEPDAVIVVDNASTDHTREVLDAARGLPLQRDPPRREHRRRRRLPGRRARRRTTQGFDRIWLMDDDVVPAPDCLAVLMAAGRARA